MFCLSLLPGDAAQWEKRCRLAVKDTVREGSVRPSARRRTSSSPSERSGA